MAHRIYYAINNNKTATGTFNVNSIAFNSILSFTTDFDKKRRSAGFYLL